jgi:hypothetical protein
MAKLAVTSKGVTKNNEYWVRVSQTSEDEGFIDTGFLAVTKALYDKVATGKTIDVPDNRANRVKWDV